MLRRTCSKFAAPTRAFPAEVVYPEAATDAALAGFDTKLGMVKLGGIFGGIVSLFVTGVIPVHFEH
jgi:hypothetical protein